MKTSQYARYILPSVVDPPERVCYVVPVPNDREHIAAFLGQILELAKATSWSNDPAHTALQVAAVWRPIFDGLLLRSCTLIGGDDMQFRQNGCKLEYSLDCVNWNLLYDPTNCVALGVTQPGADGVLTAGECRTYTAVLQGNGIYLLPVPVQEGYRITISDAVGGWNDGSGVGGWYCPDGVPYVLGVCVGVPGHVGGDPDASEFHGQLIAKAGALFFPASSGTFVIPVGEPLENLEFIMNDASIADNAGSITFNIEVCAEAPSSFTHTFDFSVDDGGWVDAGNGSTYVAASYWLGGSAGGSNVNGDAYISRTGSAPRLISSVIVTFTSIANTGSNQLSNVHMYSGVANVFNGSQAQVAGAAQTISYAPSVSLDKIVIDYNAGSATGTETRILSVVVVGFGTDPF